MKPGICIEFHCWNCGLRSPMICNTLPSDLGKEVEFEEECFHCRKIMTAKTTVYKAMYKTIKTQRKGK